MIAPDIDLAGHGRGDQRRAAFLEQVDGVQGFGGEVVEFGGFGVEEGNHYLLFR